MNFSFKEFRISRVVFFICGSRKQVAWLMLQLNTFMHTFIELKEIQQNS